MYPKGTLVHAKVTRSSQITSGLTCLTRNGRTKLTTLRTAEKSAVQSVARDLRGHNPYIQSTRIPMQQNVG